MHVSQLADRFVKDAHEIVKAGDVVKVRVVDVDIARKRIGLSMRRETSAGIDKPVPREDNRRQNATRHGQGKPGKTVPQGAFGAAFAEALKKR